MTIGIASGRKHKIHGPLQIFWIRLRKKMITVITATKRRSKKKVIQKTWGKNWPNLGSEKIHHKKGFPCTKLASGYASSFGKLCHQSSKCMVKNTFDKKIDTLTQWSKMMKKHTQWNWVCREPMSSGRKGDQILKSTQTQNKSNKFKARC